MQGKKKRNFARESRELREKVENLREARRHERQSRNRIGVAMVRSQGSTVRRVFESGAIVPHSKTWRNIAHPSNWRSLLLF